MCAALQDGNTGERGRRPPVLGDLGASFVVLVFDLSCRAKESNTKDTKAFTKITTGPVG